MIDFTEIPVANKGGANQDKFEQFCRDFLENLGFEIVSQPDRGPDGKKDLIVRETLSGTLDHKDEILWLVSCKHYAASTKAVKDIDEQDIWDRVKKFNCRGFMAFYSTIPASSLGNKFDSFHNEIKVQVFDGQRIEKLLTERRELWKLMPRYFPESYVKNKELFHERVEQGNDGLDETKIFQIAKSAIVVIEIDKIISEFFQGKRDERLITLTKVNKFVYHSDERIAKQVLFFLNMISEETRAGMSKELSSSIHSILLLFLPPYKKEKHDSFIDLLKDSINIGYNLVYDSLIYLNNYGVASNGLLILKYIHTLIKKEKIGELSGSVIKKYNDLHSQFERPERPDLIKAIEFIQYFKDDLENKYLILPPLPDHIYKLVVKSE